MSPFSAAVGEAIAKNLFFEGIIAFWANRSTKKSGVCSSVTAIQYRLVFLCALIGILKKYLYK